MADDTISKLLKYFYQDSIPARAVKSAWSGLTFPGDVMAGKADPYDYGRALDTAGLLTLGAGAVPASSNELRMGGLLGEPVKRVTNLPSSESLSIPLAPTVEQLTKLARKEEVTLSNARSSQSKMDWDKFNSGVYGEPMFKGYEDAPVAALKRNGEYIVFDGHHRAVKAINDGSKTLKMYVIDASAYDPANAGVARSAARQSARWSSDDEELLRGLLGD